jgi:hypothetical protein
MLGSIKDDLEWILNESADCWRLMIDIALKTEA